MPKVDEQTEGAAQRIAAVKGGVEGDRLAVDPSVLEHPDQKGGAGADREQRRAAESRSSPDPDQDRRQDQHVGLLEQEDRAEADRSQGRALSRRQVDRDHRQRPGEALDQEQPGVEPERGREVEGEGEESRRGLRSGQRLEQPVARQQSEEARGQRQRAESEIGRRAGCERLEKADERRGKRREPDRVAHVELARALFEMAIEPVARELPAGGGRAPFDFQVVLPEIHVAIHGQRVRHQREVGLVAADQRRAGDEGKGVDQEETGQEQPAPGTICERHEAL